MPHPAIPASSHLTSTDPLGDPFPNLGRLLSLFPLSPLRFSKRHVNRKLSGNRNCPTSEPVQHFAPPPALFGNYDWQVEGDLPVQSTAPFLLTYEITLRQGSYLLKRISRPPAKRPPRALLSPLTSTPREPRLRENIPTTPSASSFPLFDPEPPKEISGSDTRPITKTHPSTKSR